MFHILRILTFTSAGIFVGFYLFYLAVCILNLKTRRMKIRSISTSEHSPKVSIVIPTYNEAKVIPRKMENLQLLHYPKDKLEVVFIDGGSTDGTANVIKDSAKDACLSVKIIQQGERKGFNNAVIEGFVETVGEIICITGAETEYDPEALSIMVEEFTDPRIGAVTGKQTIKNVEEGYSPKLEVAYRSLYDLLREAESSIDSPFDIKGEICAARRSVIAHLVEKPEVSEKGCIDCCISFQARKDGLKTVYEPRATYCELSPKSIKDSFTQQTRRAATLIENMMLFKDMILSREFGGFGMLIMPAHLLMLIILPFLLLIGSTGIVMLVIFNPSNYLLLALTGVIIFIVMASPRLQAFLKAQLALVVANLKLLIGTETQKFKRLATTRP